MFPLRSVINYRNTQLDGFLRSACSSPCISKKHRNSIQVLSAQHSRCICSIADTIPELLVSIPALVRIVDLHARWSWQRRWIGTDHVKFCDHFTEVFACVELAHACFWIPLNSTHEKVVSIFFNYIKRFLKVQHESIPEGRIICRSTSII
jgi:hypothetical protein